MARKFEDKMSGSPTDVLDETENLRKEWGKSKEFLKTSSLSENSYLPENCEKSNAFRKDPSNFLPWERNYDGRAKLLENREIFREFEKNALENENLTGKAFASNVK